MKLYIARDRDGDLFLYRSEPLRYNENIFDTIDIVGSLHSEQFPEITWENSPQEVELKLCNTDFDRIIEENKDVLQRIKDNGD